MKFQDNLRAMRIDAHQHFWDLNRFRYPWMPPEPSPLRRNFLPEHLRRILERNRFDGSVVVQATTTMDETRWLLDLAQDYAFILGVVGWIDLTDPRIGDVLDELQGNPRFKGVRHPVHDEADPIWLMRDDVMRGLGELAQRDIPYDLLLFPQHLPLVPRIADRVPRLRMVIDHIAKPRIANIEIDGWAEDIERAAALPQVYAKLSGMITEADHKNWNVEQLRPYVQHVLRVFGPGRLMFGSDWPMCLPAGSWKEVLAAFTQAVGPLPTEIRDKLLGGTAVNFYALAETTITDQITS